jgi:hypothetical protein
MCKDEICGPIVSLALELQNALEAFDKSKVA